MLGASLKTALPILAGTDTFAQLDASDEWLEGHFHWCLWLCTKVGAPRAESVEIIPKLDVLSRALCPSVCTRFAGLTREESSATRPSVSCVSARLVGQRT